MKKENELWSQFCNGCSSQWRAAGNKRFAYDDKKELSDVITDILGNSWLGGQILKYTGEIWNMKRMDGIVPEVNFFKIVVYIFIWWLKEFRQKYTNPALKEKYWPEFIKKMRDYYKNDLEDSIAITKEQFIVIIRILKENEKNNEWVKPRDEKLLFAIGARSYRWWLQELGNFTDRDEGEEFEK